MSATRPPALHLTAAGHRGCNRCASWLPSMSLIRCAAAHTRQIRHFMEKIPNGPFWLGAVALSLATMFTACQSTPTPAAVELKRLQGYWVGVGSESNTSITITGHSFHYHSRTDFWFKTTFTLPAGTDPQQLRATIKDCSPPKDPIGKVVVAIYKIEDGTLTLANLQSGEPPKRLEDEGNQLTVLRKAQPPNGVTK